MNKLDCDKCPDTNFENYNQICDAFSKEPSEFENFKRHPKYHPILEGGFICVNYRHKYLDEGCIFADIDVAKYFSHETMLP